MKKVLSILAWGAVAAILAVIVFVRTPNNNGQSGGKQASDIIKAGGGALSGIINSLTGGNAGAN